jgi:hypothetical protein
MSAIGLDIQHGDVRQRILIHPLGPFQPPAELFQGPQIVVAGLLGHPLGTQRFQVGFDLVGFQVGSLGEFTAEKNPADFRGNLVNLLGTDITIPQVFLESIQVVFEGSLTVGCGDGHSESFPDHSGFVFQLGCQAFGFGFVGEALGGAAAAPS